MSWIKRNIDPSVADFIFTIKVDLKDRTYFQRDIRPDIIIDYEDLENQLVEVPEMLAFYDILLAEQKIKVMVFMAQREARKGQLVEEMTERATRQGVKLSVQVIKDLIMADDRMSEIEAKIIKETRVELRLKAVVNSLNRKSEHLRSLAGFKRDERK